MLKHTLFICIFLPLITFGQFSEKKTYTAKQIQNPPKIDGKLNDNVWNNLNNAKNFSQIEPKNGEKEREHQRTEVKICYDNKNIYFGVMMYDNAPDSILKELSIRDEENKNFDAFAIFIDPFNDAQMEYNFMITAAGVQIDRKFSKTGIDKTWNPIWHSQVSINKDGWIAEFAIPFSQLRFPNNNTDWALNMARTIRRCRTDYAWNPINNAFSNYALQAGTLEGITNIQPPLRLSFLPYASIYSNFSDQEISFALTSQKKVVSVQSYYMDETEITNDEYRQFVYHVRDSLALSLLGEEDPEVPISIAPLVSKSDTSAIPSSTKIRTRSKLCFPFESEEESWSFGNGLALPPSLVDSNSGEFGFGKEVIPVTWNSLHNDSSLLELEYQPSIIVLMVVIVVVIDVVIVIAVIIVIHRR